MMSNEKLTFRENLKKFKKDYQDPVKKKVRARKTGMFLGSFFRTLILIGLIFIIILPIFQKISYAFRHPNTIADPQIIWIPSEFSIVNIQIAAKLLNFGETVWNTLFLSFVAMLLQIMATSLIGYAFARLRYKGSEILFYFTLF